MTLLGAFKPCARTDQMRFHGWAHDRDPTARRSSRVKTARFANVVKAKGTPETFLAFTDPAKDHGFQAALKAHRVMTVFQQASGQKTDHGEVGFQPGHSRQFLIFPKSLKAYADSTIVGIKYDMLGGFQEPEKGQTVKKQSHAPAPAKQARPERARKPPRKAVLKSRKQAPKAGKPKKPAPVPKPVAQEKIILFPPPAKSEASIADLKKIMRRAMGFLEDGKAVAAFNLLEKTVNES